MVVTTEMHACHAQTSNIDEMGKMNENIEYGRKYTHKADNYPSPHAGLLKFFNTDGLIINDKSF